MFAQVLPALINVHTLNLSLNTASKNVIASYTDKTPRPNTLAKLFHDSDMTLPALRAFSLRETSYHIHIDRFLNRHTHLRWVHLDCGVFDFLPIPDLINVRSLKSLTHFGGSLANVNYILTHCETCLTSLAIVGGPGSGDEVESFLQLMKENPGLRCLRLNECGGYIGDCLVRYLSCCGNIESLAVTFRR